MTVTVAGLELSSPVLAASGCAGSGRDLARLVPLTEFGAVVTRSITLAARPGGPLPRLVETPSGLVNALGLPGPGVEDFVGGELPQLLATGATVVVSVWGRDSAEFGKVAQRLRQVEGIAAVEVNVSHPGGRATDPAAAVHQVRRNTAGHVPVFAKLGADDAVAVARSCLGAGAAGLALVNAVPALPVVDGRAALGAVVGGLSGPAIAPLALRAVWQVHEAFPDVPLIGSGGVMTGADALALIAAGASAVAVGTALLHDPTAGPRIARELAGLLAGRPVDAVRGTALHSSESEDPRSDAAHPDDRGAP